MYEFLTEKEHIITVRNRETGKAKQSRFWDESVISKVLAKQSDSEDVFVSKYPKNRLIRCVILDFDSDDKSVALKDVRKIKNLLRREGHNVVVVDSTNKGYHLYIQIAPLLCRDTDLRWHDDWSKFFREFVNFLISNTSNKYATLDAVNSNASLGGNIRLIGSKHPSTGERVRIIDGDFKELQKPTPLQDKAQRVAWRFCEILEQNRKRMEGKTRLVNGSNPIESNDLRVVLPSIFSEDIKIYPKGYGFMKCPWHNDNSPSLLVTKEYFSCASCGAKGNIFTLKKKGLVEFNYDGEVIL